VLRILINPYKGMKRLRKKYGDLFLVRLVPMGNVVLTSRPELLQKIFKLPPESFTVLKVPMLEFFFGKYCLFILDGKEHYSSRKLMAPYFKADLMRTYAEIMERCTLKECASYEDGQEISQKEIAQNTTIEILMRVLFGIEEDSAVDHIKSIFEAWNSSQSPLLGFRWLRGGNRGPHAEFVKYNTLIRDLIGDLIAGERREESPGNNILSLLVTTHYEDGTPMTDEHITDTLITLLVAGYDTTANTLSWAFEVIHREPEILEKVVAELDGLPKDAPLHELTKLPMLDAYCHEITRHYPPIENLTVRVLKEPLELGGYTLPAGTGVTGSAIITNFDPDLYPDPDAFKPERFIGKKPSNHELVSFGGGVRLCIGYALARYQMRVVLGTALRYHKFTALGKGTKPKRYSVLVGPANSCPATIASRASTSPPRKSS
jgi:cytochrome P450